MWIIKSKTIIFYKRKIETNVSIEQDSKFLLWENISKRVETVDCGENGKR